MHLFFSIYIAKVVDNVYIHMSMSIICVNIIRQKFIEDLENMISQSRLNRIKKTFKKFSF